MHPGRKVTIEIPLLREGCFTSEGQPGEERRGVLGVELEEYGVRVL